MMRILPLIFLVGCAVDDKAIDLHAITACSPSLQASVAASTCESPCSNASSFEFARDPQPHGTCEADYSTGAIGCHAGTEFEIDGVSGCCVLVSDGGAHLEFAECR